MADLLQVVDNYQHWKKYTTIVAYCYLQRCISSHWITEHRHLLNASLAWHRIGLLVYRLLRKLQRQAA